MSSSGYKIRPRRKVLEKIKLVTEGMRVIPPSVRGIRIALEENIPLGDGIFNSNSRREEYTGNSVK